MQDARPNSLPGGHSKWEPPDSIPNSEVKTLSADDSVGLPHVKVGHCRAFIPKSPNGYIPLGLFSCPLEKFCPTANVYVLQGPIAVKWSGSVFCVGVSACRLANLDLRLSRNRLGKWQKNTSPLVLLRVDRTDLSGVSDR